jgi:hypothetical protein
VSTPLSTSASVATGAPVGSPGATASRPTAKEAIDAYLAPYDAKAPSTSFLAAAIRDADTAIKSDALWLGTLGYLIAVEQIGHCVQRKSTTPRSGEPSRASFVAASGEFGDRAVDKPSRQRLYDVRCALAHEYSLQKEKLEFTYARGNTMLQKVDSRNYTVCLDAVWKYVTELVNNLRSEHAKGNVILVQKMTIEVLLRKRFEVKL